MLTSSLFVTRARNLRIRRIHSNEQHSCRKQDVFNDVSASQPQQATSDYPSLALYARASSVAFPADHHLRPAILRVEEDVEVPAENSQVQQQHYCRPSRGFRFASGAVAASTDVVSMLFRLGGLWWEWFQSENLETLLATFLESKRGRERERTQQSYFFRHRRNCHFHRHRRRQRSSWR